MPETNKFQDYGFAFMPYLNELNTDGDATTIEWYVISGIFSLPVYSGKL